MILLLRGVIKMQNRNVPKATLQRYPVYLKALRKLQKMALNELCPKNYRAL